MLNSIEYLRAGHAVGRGSAGGPMAEVIDVSLSKLAPDDLRAVVAYLRSVPAIRTPDLPAPKDESGLGHTQTHRGRC